MNRENDDPMIQDAEATLRLIAGVPVPAGLEERVHAALASAQKPKAERRVLTWPTAGGGAAGAWLRSAAAAAIALAVVGGGWSVYSRVKPWQPTRAIPLPASGSQGGFGGAGAIRTPQTLNGPVLTHAPKAAAEQRPIKKKEPARKPAVQKSVVAGDADNR